MYRKLPLITALSTALMACGTASAAITVYTSQASFLSAVSAPATDTFDDLSIGASFAGPVDRSAGPYAYSVTTAPTAFLFVAGAGSDAWLSTNTATDSIVFLSFGNGVRAAGGFFFGSDFNGSFATSDIRVTASDTDGSVERILPGATTTSFLGFVSTIGLAGLQVDALQPPNAFAWPTINDLTLAASTGGPVRVVPLPGALALMVPALLLTGLVARRRRR